MVDGLLLRAPGVYRPQSDTEALVRAICGSQRSRGAHVLDLCTGTGATALAAARSGAASVTAVELSRRAVHTARINAWMHRSRVRVEHGDLFAPVRGRRFDLISANPPYVPSRSDRLPRYRGARSWDGGRTGRVLIDRICRGAVEHLRPGGGLIMVHSAVSAPGRTIELLTERGMAVHVVGRTRIPLGPVMRARAVLHEQRGLTEPGAMDEELVVIEARRD